MRNEDCGKNQSHNEELQQTGHTFLMSRGLKWAGHIGHIGWGHIGGGENSF